MKIKRFIVAVVSPPLQMLGGVAPSVSRIIVLLRGRHGEQPGHSLDTAWTHDRWWLHAAEQCCPVFLRKFSGMVPTLHGDRLSEKALELESVLRRIIIIMSTEKSCKVTFNTIIS